MMDIYSQLEHLRQKSNNWGNLCIGAFVMFFVLLFILPFIVIGLGPSMNRNIDPNEFKILFWVIGMGFMVLIAVASVQKSKYYKQFQSLYKNNFLVGLLRQWFPDAQFNWEQGFTEQAVNAVGLVERGNRFHSEDFICGTYNGVFFEQSDVTIKRVVRSGKHTHTYTHFKGRMFTFNYDMKDIASTLVFSDSFGYKGHGFNLRYEKVPVESVHFNDKFKIRSVRPVDAFYVLTPQMMECVMRLNDYLGNIALHFTPGKVHVGFNTNINAFDVNVKNPIDFRREAELRRQDMQIIIDIINALKISNDNKPIYNNQF
ncbi:MAG: DUF3137 domain-containing protein [Lachnospiraceae bacterium]|nr:DUF3137 domain-containing protein [Lachnospiraceae bacterium]